MRSWGECWCANWSFVQRIVAAMEPLSSHDIDACVSNFFLLLWVGPNTTHTANTYAHRICGDARSALKRIFCNIYIMYETDQNGIFLVHFPSRFPWKFIVKNPQPKTLKYKSSRFVLLCLDTTIYCAKLFVALIIFFLVLSHSA